MIDTKKLILEAVDFEAKFSQGYLYWYRCGWIWKALKEALPTIQMETIDPQKAVLKTADSNVTVTFNPEQIILAQRYPKTTDTFHTTTDTAVEVIADALEIETFTRIGTRYRHIYPLKDVDAEAVELLSRTGFFGRPQGKLKNFGANLIEPDLKFVIHDGEIGIIVKLETTKRKVTITVPPPVTVDTSAYVLGGLTIDLDRYTLKPVERSTIHLDEWLAVTERNFKKAITELFAEIRNEE